MFMAVSLVTFHVKQRGPLGQVADIVGRRPSPPRNRRAYAEGLMYEDIQWTKCWEGGQ